jgi:hypothetical protein
MSTPDYRLLSIALTILVFLFAGLLIWLGWEFLWLRLHLSFASDQTEIFQEMRDRALRSDVAEAAGCLDYTVNYYPSGTKQEIGSPFDRMVERERAMAIRDIIIYLRSKTGEDLGDDPEVWVQKFAPK